MKLLTIIFLSSFAFGQVFVPIHTEKSTIDTIDYLFSGEATWIARDLTDVKIINRPITINDYLEYAEECYNVELVKVCADSMGFYKWRMLTMTMARDGYYITDESQWEYCVYFKKQPTLPGLIEWLKK